MNFSVIVIAVMFALLVVLAGYVVIRERKRNKDGCVGCPYRDKCPKKEYDEDRGDANEI